MKIFRLACLALACAAAFTNADGQGFVNLNFENGTIVQDFFPFVYASNAIPGWTAYISGVPQADIVYNTVPLGDAEVTLQGTNNGGYQAVQGKYFAMLWGQFNPTQNGTETNTAAIGQTGQIPISARSLTFWGTIGALQATFNGQTLNFTTIGNTANYTVYGTDISAFAGQTGQLLFTDPPYGNTFGGPAILDNIQFSSSPVPEPNILNLFTAGILLLGWRIGRLKVRQL